MARKAARAKDIRMAQILSSATGIKGYDGQNFFSTTHTSKGYKTAQSNYVTDRNFNRNNVQTTIQELMGFKDDQGEPIAQSNFYVIVPTVLYFDALEAMRSVLLDGGGSNILVTENIEIIKNPHLPTASTAAQSSWYVGSNDSEKPMIMQNREEIEFVSVDPKSSGNTALNWLFYTYGRYEAAVGEWRSIIRCR